MDELNQKSDKIIKKEENKSRYDTSILQKNNSIILKIYGKNFNLKKFQREETLIDEIVFYPEDVLSFIGRLFYGKEYINYLMIKVANQHAQLRIKELERIDSKTEKTITEMWDELSRKRKEEESKK